MNEDDPQEEADRLVELFRVAAKDALLAKTMDAWSEAYDRFSDAFDELEDLIAIDNGSLR